MGNEKSKPNGSAIPSTNIPQTAVLTEEKTEVTRMNMFILRDVYLIWLDGNIDYTKSDCQNTMKNLSRTSNQMKTFSDMELCIQFLNTIVDKRICLIISGAFGSTFVPRVHNMLQVDSIFIFCANKLYHEVWAKEWAKIKNVFTEIEPICDTLKESAQQSERNGILISIINPTDGLNKKNLDLPFVYTHVMKEIFSKIHFGPKHIQQMIEYCRKLLTNDDDYLKDIDEFEGNYHDQTPIWWYTREFFLYHMLDRAFRMMDISVIIKCGVFLADLERQIERLHEAQFGDNGSNQRFVVYRGQGITQETFAKISTTPTGLLSFNCFFSTSKDRQISLEYAKRALINPEMIGILFVMNIDAARFTTPFAAIGKVGYFGEKEDDVFFSIRTVFRISTITMIDGNDRLMQVELTLINDSDYELRQLIDRIEEESFPDLPGWHRLGSVLRKLKQLSMAQQVYEILLEHETDASTKASIYSQLAMMKHELGEYLQAIEYFQCLIDIEERSSPRNDQSLSHSYNNIGMTYFRMGDYPEALKSYEKALELKEHSLPPMHPQLASSYGNIGSVHFSIGDYPKALAAHDRALQIKQKTLSPNHPSLAMSYNNIGNVYSSMGDYKSALISYEKALVIRQQSLSPTDLHLASSYNNMGLVYNRMGDYSKALSCHEKALAIQQNSLSSTHPDLITTYNNLGVVHEKMGNFSKAHAYFELAVSIAERALPSNHPDLEKWKNNLADVQKKL